jgi:hypothetical protein
MNERSAVPAQDTTTAPQKEKKLGELFFKISQFT